MLIGIIGNAADSLLNFRASLIRHLVARGHEVVAFAPDYDARTKAQLEGLGARPGSFPLSRSGTSPLHDLGTVRALRRAFARSRPDAVLCYFIKPAIYGTLAATLARVPRRLVMLEGLGYSFAEGERLSLRQRLVNRLVRALLRLALSRAQVTLVLNDDDRRELVERVGVAPSRVLNIGGIGVELGHYQASPLRERATTFVMAARLIAEKGVLQYVEAARRIRAEHGDSRFLLLGDVDDNPHSFSRDQIASLCAEAGIEWPGYVTNVQDYLKQADVFVLPSYYREGVPRSTQEAMALGLAIVTTDHVGCRDTVDDGVNGFLVPPRDVEALVDAMQALIEKPGLARRMGEASRALAEERFNAEKFDVRLTQLLECG